MGNERLISQRIFARCNNWEHRGKRSKGRVCLQKLRRNELRTMIEKLDPTNETQIAKTTADSFLRTYLALILLARFIRFLFLDIYSGETLGNWKFVFCLVYTSNTFLKFVFAARKERLSKENRIWTRTRISRVFEDRFNQIKLFNLPINSSSLLNFIYKILWFLSTTFFQSTYSNRFRFKEVSFYL